MHTAGIGAVGEIEPLGKSAGDTVQLPTRRTVYVGWFAKNLLVTFPGPFHLPADPVRILPRCTFAPLKRVKPAYTGLESAVADRAHDVGGPASDVRCRQQRAEEQSTDPVTAYAPGAPQTTRHSSPKQTPDMASAAVGPDAEQKGGACGLRVQ